VGVLDVVRVPAGGAGMVDPVSIGPADVGRGKHELQFARAKIPQVDRQRHRILAIEDVWVDRWGPAGCCVEPKRIVVVGARTDERNVHIAGVDDELLIPVDGVCMRLAGASGVQREDENEGAGGKQGNPLPGGQTQTPSLRLHHTFIARLAQTSVGRDFLLATVTPSLPVYSIVILPNLKAGKQQPPGSLITPFGGICQAPGRLDRPKFLRGPGDGEAASRASRPAGPPYRRTRGCTQSQDHTPDDGSPQGPAEAA
jgi:hypothetical protein